MNIKVIDKILKWWGIGFIVLLLISLWEVTLIMGSVVLIGFLFEKGYSYLKESGKFIKKEGK